MTDDTVTINEVPLALVRACKSTDDLRTIYVSGFDWEWTDEATDLAMKKILAWHGDDMFMLFSMLFDEKENSKWSTWVCNRIFDEIMNQCKTLPPLILFYKALPGVPEPGVDENYHEKVVERMIEVAGTDMRKLFIIFRHLDKEAKGEFGAMIMKRITELANKK